MVINKIERITEKIIEKWFKWLEKNEKIIFLKELKNNSLYEGGLWEHDKIQVGEYEIFFQFKAIWMFGYTICMDIIKNTMGRKIKLFWTSKKWIEEWIVLSRNLLTWKIKYLPND